jgi:hypothetical protein
MRGRDKKQPSIFVQATVDSFVPESHPLREVKMLFDAVVLQANERNLLGSQHFSVDGSLIEAAASMKSFRPKDDDDDEG